MKILHITNHFYPCRGGVERNVLELCRQLIKKGHVSDVLCLNRCPGGPKLPSREEYGKIRIFRVPFIDLKYYKVGLGILKHLSDYDAVHVHGLGYFFDFLAQTKKLHRKKLILSTHGGFFHTRNLLPLKRIHFRTLTRLSLKKADSIVAVSRQDAETFSAITKNIHYIPNGIDYGKFSGSRQKKKNTFVYVGRIAKNKKIDNLIKAFGAVAEKNRKAKLYIVGRDFDRLVPWLGKIAKNQNIERNVVFTGDVSEKRKLEYLSMAAFFVSASEYEGFGIAVLEGMASGCVPILNKIQAFEDIINGNGFLLDYSRPETAGKAILAILEKDLKKMQKMAREEARKYDWKNIIGRWEEVYG
jgi:alpha-1,3-mannosyltransferase